MDAWRVFITPAAERVAAKLPKPAEQFVIKEFPLRVRLDPYIGSKLTGPLSWLYSFHFSFDGNPYRIAYEIDAKNAKIVIHYAGYRGGFYERLRRLLRS